MKITRVLVVFLLVWQYSLFLSVAAAEQDTTTVQSQEDSEKTIGSVVTDIAIVLGSLVFHEFSHACAATLLGDNTPRAQGRLTLNPFAHLDPLGTLCIIVVQSGVLGPVPISGWARPVPFDSRNFSHQHLGTILTALAGPLSNVFLAYLASVIAQGVNPSSSAAHVLRKIKQANIKLAAFNLLPIPPLDGSHLYGTFLAEKYPDLYRFLYRYGIVLLFALLTLPEMETVLAKMETLLSKATLTIPEDTSKKECVV